MHPWITKGQSLCAGDPPIAVPEGWDDLDIVSEGGQYHCYPPPHPCIKFSGTHLYMYV